MGNVEIQLLDVFYFTCLYISPNIFWIERIKNEKLLNFRNVKVMMADRRIYFSGHIRGLPDSRPSLNWMPQ